jgi:hypothetical protein
MNPFFEQCWRDAHTRLITYLCDAIQEQLPADLVVRTEKEVVTLGASGPGPAFRPDVQVQEAWQLKETTTAPPAVAAPGPIHLLINEEVERWLEVRDDTGRLVTVLELLSPSNKSGTEERDRHVRKRHAFMSSSVNKRPGCAGEGGLTRQRKPVMLPCSASAQCGGDQQPPAKEPVRNILPRSDPGNKTPNGVFLRGSRPVTAKVGRHVLLSPGDGLLEMAPPLDWIISSGSFGFLSLFERRMDHGSGLFGPGEGFAQDLHAPYLSLADRQRFLARWRSGLRAPVG